jgi:hypothetical protein
MRTSPLQSAIGSLIVVFSKKRYHGISSPLTRKTPHQRFELSASAERC